MERQEPGRWNLCPYISGAMVACESAHIAQSLRPMRRLHRARLLRPRQGQLRRNVGRPTLLHEGREMGQRSTGVVQLESQATP